MSFPRHLRAATGRYSGGRGFPAAFPSRRDTSLAKRAAVLFSVAELLNARKNELGAMAVPQGAISRELESPRYSPDMVLVRT
jgi:hypothetical protein